jgi:hypothetical protein
MCLTAYASTQPAFTRTETHGLPIRGSRLVSLHAIIVLIGFVGSGGLKVSAEILKHKREGQLAGNVKTADRQVIFDLPLFLPRDTLVVRMQGFLDLLSLDVVADPVLVAAFVQVSHDNLPFCPKTTITEVVFVLMRSA